MHGIFSNRKIGGHLYMTKAELVTSIATKAEVSNAQADNMVNAFVETVKETMGKGESIQLVGFGTFEVRDRAARTAKNPRTGEDVMVAACKVPAFKAGSKLKEAVNA